MQVTIASRHMEVTPALKAFAEERAARLGKYYDRIRDVEVVVDSGKDQVRVEMIVSDEHLSKFIAHSAEGDAYACIDACYGKLERQLSEHKKKLRNRKHSGEANHGLV
jgi:putative sigma-54 modulation protein